MKHLFILSFVSVLYNSICRVTDFEVFSNIAVNCMKNVFILLTIIQNNLWIKDGLWVKTNKRLMIFGIWTSRITLKPLF